MRWQAWATNSRRRGRLTLPGSLAAAGLVVLLLQLGLALIDYARLAGAAVAFPYPLEYSEGPVLDQAVRLAQLESIYPASFDTPPYTLTTTPPLYQLIAAPLTLLFGPAYWYGRLLSILSALAAAVFIGLIVHALTRDRIAALVGAVTLLVFPYLLQWSLYARADALALALSLGGLYVIVRASLDHQPDARAVWLSGLLMTAAVYTRQSFALAAPLAALVWLWHGRNRRSALRLAGIFFGSVLGLWIGLNLATRGGFYRHLANASLGPVSWDIVAGRAAELYLNAGYLLVACLLFVIVEPLGERTRSWPLVIAYLVGAALTTVFAGQWSAAGADLFVMAAALCLATGAMLAWTGERAWLRAALLLVLALQANELANWSRADYRPAVTRRLNDEREIARLAELVRQAPGPVLADEYMGLLPLYGRRILFQPFEYRQLAAAGLWDSAPLAAAIARQEFAAILMYQPPIGPGLAIRWAPELRQTIYAHYTTHETLADTLVYQPQEEAP